MGKSKQKEISPKLLETDWQKQAREKLTGLMDREYQPYTGQVFGEYPYRSELLGTLGSYIGRQTPELYGQAQGELSKTLTGEYDPYTSPYYQATREAMERETQAGLNQLRRGAQLGGMLISTPRLETEADYLSEATSKLGQVLGGLAETERARRLAAVPTAMAVGQQIENQPLQTMQAISSVSPILKALQEEPLQFAYQQYMQQQLWPYEYQLPVAQTLLNYAPWYFPQYAQTSKGFGGLGSGLGALTGALINTTSPLLGALIGSQVGGGLGGLF